MIKVISGLGAVMSVIAGNLSVAAIFAVILALSIMDDTPSDDEEPIEVSDEDDNDDWEDRGPRHL